MRTRARTLITIGVTAVVTAALTAGGTSWFLLREEEPAVAGATTRTVTASLTTVQHSVSASGTLTPTVQEQVAFEVSGTVTAVAVTAGQEVAEGEVLATIDTLELNADLLEARATLASAEARLDSAEDDDDGSDAAQAQIDAAAAQVEVATAAVERAEEALADATLVAPVSGLVTTADLSVGDTVGSGAAGAGMTGGQTSTTAPFTIVSTDSWMVETTVGDADVALIQVGDQVEITPEDGTATLFGTVSEIDLVSSNGAGVPAFPVTVLVTGEVSGLFDGVDVDLEIVYQRRTDVLTVPSGAVRTVDGTSVVDLVVGETDETVDTAADDGTATGAPTPTTVETVVTVGETVDGMTEILTGLAEGDQVLVTVVTSERDGTGTGLPGGMTFPDGITFPEGFEPPEGVTFPEGGPGGGFGGGGAGGGFGGQG